MISIFFGKFSLGEIVSMVVVLYLILDFVGYCISVIRSRGWITILWHFVQIVAFCISLSYLLIKLPNHWGYEVNINEIMVDNGAVEGVSSDGLTSGANAAEPPLDQVTSNCNIDGVTFCSDFSNIEGSFDHLADFTQDQLNPRILETNLPIESDKDNSILKVKDMQFSPVFNFKLVTRLRNKNKGNLTITYGRDWRCIIGEADHKKVTCQSEYDKKDSPRQTKYLSTYGKPDILTDTELTVDGSVTLGVDNNYNIRLILRYFDDKSNPVDAELDFKVKYKSNNIMDSKKQFGVGIIDPSDEGIKIEFQKLEISGGQ